MKTVSISGSRRENVGKKDAKAQRRNEMVPCVLYGGEQQICFTTSVKSFNDIVFSPEVCFVEIEIEGGKHIAILQEIQYHPVSDEILHADFMEIHDNKPIVMKVPVGVTGNSKGVLKGGKLVIKIKKMKVKSLPVNMPEKIIIDITELDIAQGRKVGEIQTNNYEFLDNKSSEVVIVKATRSSAKE